MKKLVATIYVMVALIGPSFAQDAPAVGKKAKPKQVSECRRIGTVKGAKLWAGNCVAPEPTAPPVAEAEPPKDAMRGEQQ